MRQILDDDIPRYIGETLCQPPPILQPWNEAAELPRYLTQAYDFRELMLLRTSCVLLAPTGKLSALDDVQKHLQLIERRAQRPVLLGLDSVTPTQRKRLIERHIAFVVPDRQLYLPPLGIDLRERFAAEPRQPSVVLSRSTQAILFAGLLGKWGDHAYSAELARWLGYSSMTLSRARKELEEHELLAPTIPGVSAPKSSWELTITARELLLEEKYGQILRTPVVRRVWLDRHDLPPENLPLAGLSALAAQTMLVEPGVQVFAMTEDRFKALTSRRAEVFEAPQPGCIELELWAYDPATVTDETAPYVDSLSLYVSLQDAAIHDERIAQACHQLIESLAP